MRSAAPVPWLLLALLLAPDAALAQDAPALGRLVVESTLLERAQSALGVVALLAVAWALSVDRRRVSWRLVGVGMALQVGLGAFTLTSPGQWFFGWFNGAVGALLGYTTQGAGFVFGDLAQPGSKGFIAFGVLPTIIFFSSVMAILYHLGVMQRLVGAIALVMQRTMGTSGAETLCAAGNIFVGQTEAPLLVRPFLKDMTRSELMSIMTTGFATIAGGVMIAYVGMLRGVFPDIAGHLLAASVMSAPAAVVVAKIMVPETQTPTTLGRLELDLPKVDRNVLDAATRGAGEGLHLALNVGAMLIAFVALVALLNGLLGWASQAVGLAEPLTLEAVLGWVGAPVAWLLGVSAKDAAAVGALFGTKTILNEFVAYLQLAELAPRLEPRSILIAAYGLCGFANLGSIGIQIGGIGALVPERRGELAALGLRAMVAGTLAAFMTGAVIAVIL